MSPISLAPEFLVLIDIQDALISIGFTKNPDGCLEWQWQDLKITAGFSIGGWLIQAQRYTKRTVLNLHKIVSSTAIKGWYVAEIYTIGRDEFPITQVSLFNEDLKIPDGLISGKQYLDYLHILKKLVPPNPWIQVDRINVRVFVNQLKELSNDLDPEIDLSIEIFFENNQIAIQYNGDIAYMPANANWIGYVTFAMRHFLQVCKRFDHEIVRFEYCDSSLRIGNKSIKAEWHE